MNDIDRMSEIIGLAQIPGKIEFVLIDVHTPMWLWRRKV